MIIIKNIIAILYFLLYLQFAYAVKDIDETKSTPRHRYTIGDREELRLLHGTAARLDLHGYSVQRAKQATLDLIKQSSNSGVTRLSIITGHGNHANPSGGKRKRSKITKIRAGPLFLLTRVALPLICHVLMGIPHAARDVGESMIGELEAGLTLLGLC